MSDIRQKIVKALIATKLGLTTREVSEELTMKVQVVNGSLGQMAVSGFVDRGEYIEGEGQIWKVTELGITEYGNKKDVESLLTQNEKMPVETVEPMPIIEESALEQIENEPVIKESLTTEIETVATEIETVATRMNPIQESALHDFEKHLDVKNNVPGNVLLNPELFELVKTIDENNAKIYELFTKKPKKIIFNRENKINELHKLCGSGVLNNSTVVILNEIIGDLQVA